MQLKVSRVSSHSPEALGILVEAGFPVCGKSQELLRDGMPNGSVIPGAASAAIPNALWQRNSLRSIATNAPDMAEKERANSTPSGSGCHSACVTCSSLRMVSRGNKSPGACTGCAGSFAARNLLAQDDCQTRMPSELSATSRRSSSFQSAQQPTYLFMDSNGQMEATANSSKFPSGSRK